MKSPIRYEILIPAVVLCAGSAFGQEALLQFGTTDLASEKLQRQLQSQAYTIKYGDFHMLLQPSIGFYYNDNVRLAKNGAEGSVVLLPVLRATASYPITQDYLPDARFRCWL